MDGAAPAAQVILHEDRQDVEVMYADTETRTPEWTNGGQATIGICGETPETCQMYRHFTVQVCIPRGAAG
jgi:hypothetical protein